MSLSSSSSSVATGPEVKSYSRIPRVLDIPHLIEMQLQSFELFKGEALAEVFREVSPIQDFTANKFELYFDEHFFRDPNYTPD